MRICFQRSHFSLLHPVDDIIDWRTNASVCHCELLFANGETFSAKMGQGVRYTDGKQVTPDKWIVVDLGPLDEAAIIERCNVHNGQKYDYEGVIGIFFDCPDTDCKTGAFCSMLCIQVLREACSLFQFAIPASISPGELLPMCQTRAEVLSKR